MSSEQLTLNVSLRDGFCFDSYYVKSFKEGDAKLISDSNSETLQVLQAFSSSLEPQQNILWGSSQSGKTHLLQACCSKDAEFHHSVSYIPLRIFKSHGVEVLTGLSQSQFIVIDDVDEIIGDKAWEIALFNLINICRENDQRLLMSSTENPRKLDCVLPDLASRLIWGGSYQLHTLSDEDKPKALQSRAQQRGFELTDRVIEFLYRRYPRDIESLMEILNILDKESLRQKTVITIPFVKNVLGNQ